MVLYKKSYQHSAPKNIVTNCIKASFKVLFQTLYKVDDTDIEGKRYHKFPPRVVEKGDKYIVAYSNKNAKNSVMLFDYPTKQDGDFERYLVKFNPHCGLIRTSKNIFSSKINTFSDRADFFCLFHVVNMPKIEASIFEFFVVLNPSSLPP